MLRDRKALLEHDIITLKRSAADMYLSIMVSGHVENPEYDAIKRHIADLEFDLNAVNMLIAQGHK